MAWYSRFGPKRRFAYVLEFDRRGGIYAGTEQQRSIVRNGLLDLIEFQEPLDRIMQRLAQLVKLWQGYLPITFETGIPFGRATRTHIWLNRDNPDGLMLPAFIHELGHVVGWNFFNPVDKSESWAEDFRIWTQNQPPDSPVWLRIVEAQNL